MVKKFKKYLGFAVVAIFLGAWLWLLFSVGPEKVTAFLGIQNSYIVGFALAVLGGVSSLTSAPFIAAIATFAAGGANPWLLGFCGGIGLFISDSAFYYFGGKARTLLTEKTSKRFQRLSDWMGRGPKWATSALIFVYASMTPLPNDLLMLTLAFMDYPYKKLATPLLLADITFVIILSYISQTGFRLLMIN